MRFILLFLIIVSFVAQAEIIDFIDVNGNLVRVEKKQVLTAYETVIRTSPTQIEEMWVNDDGSVTLKLPYFNYVGKKFLYAGMKVEVFTEEEHTAHLKGVCKRLGYSKYIQGKSYGGHPIDYESAIALDEEGKMIGQLTHGQDNKSVYSLSRITCRN